jgi:hypothetical protein
VTYCSYPWSGILSKPRLYGRVLLLVHIRQIEEHIIQQLLREVGTRRRGGWVSALLVPELI